MISFKQYLLREGIITGLAGSQLGMHNTLNDLPSEMPYGFWVDKSGNWLSAEYLNHVGIAQKIVKAGYAYKKDNNIDISDADRALYWDKIGGYGWPYRELENHGFMRIVKGGNTIYYQPGSAGVTQSQQKFLNHISQMYRMDTSIDDLDNL